MTPEQLAVIRAATSVIMALTAIIGVSVACFQLAKVSKSLRLNGLLGIVQMEIEMNRRGERLNAIALDIKTESDQPKTKQDSKTLRDLERRMLVESESYLNSVDRLAFCILNQYFKEREWQSEYREFLANVIRTHSEHFQPGTPYNNILKLHDKWRET